MYGSDDLERWADDILAANDEQFLPPEERISIVYGDCKDQAFELLYHKKRLGEKISRLTLLSVITEYIFEVGPVYGVSPIHFMSIANDVFARVSRPDGGYRDAISFED